MYVVVRADLPPGAQCAQACHALMAFVVQHPITAHYWHHKSNNLVVLQVPNEACLKNLALRASDERFEYAVFREPDFDDSVTAIAIEPAGARILSNLRLALKAA